MNEGTARGRAGGLRGAGGSGSGWKVPGSLKARNSGSSASITEGVQEALLANTPPGFVRLRREPGQLMFPSLTDERDSRQKRQRLWQQMVSPLLGPLRSLMGWAFPDVYWALTAYQQVSHTHQKAAEIAPQVLSAERVQTAIGEHAMLNRCSVTEAEKCAKKILKDMIADLRVPAVRFLGWILSYVWARFYSSEVYIDWEGLEHVRQLAQDCILVYVPTHKSHLDYLLLSYILFAHSIPVPHIAAGDNLCLPFVGQLLRNSGAFFIRRSMRGAPDTGLYKAILSQYVHVMVSNGNNSIEFFIEGGRSRDGKVGHPRLGLLSLVVDASLEEKLNRRVALVPLSVSYDSAVELDAYVSEQKGATKVKESLWGFIQGSVNAFRRTYGQVWVSFSPAIQLGESGEVQDLSSRSGLGQSTGSHGDLYSSSEELSRMGGSRAAERRVSTEGGSGWRPSEPSPLSLANFTTVKAYSHLWRRQLVEVLGEEAAHRIRRGTVITTTALVAAVLPCAEKFANPGDLSTAHTSDQLEARDIECGHGAGSDVGAEHWVRITDIAGWVGWLAGVLRRRGARVALGASGELLEDAMKHSIKLLREMGCVEGSGARGVVDETQRMRRREGSDVRIKLQYYSNQLLTWLAAEAVVGCAFRHVACRRAMGTGAADTGDFWEHHGLTNDPGQSGGLSAAPAEQAADNRAKGLKQWVGQLFSDEEHTKSSAAVDAQQVQFTASRAELDCAMRWLVRLMGLEVTTLLGPLHVTEAHIKEALVRLQEAGAVVSVKGGHQLGVVTDNLAWGEAMFAAAMFTPMLSTIGSCLGVVNTLVCSQSPGARSGSKLRPAASPTGNSARPRASFPPAPKLRPGHVGGPPGQPKKAVQLKQSALVAEAMKLGAVSCSDSSLQSVTPGNELDLDQMNTQMLCSIQSIKSGLQSLTSIGLLVEPGSAPSVPEQNPPRKRLGALPAELSKRSESSKELPSYDSVQSLHTLEMLCVEADKAQGVTQGSTEVRSSNAASGSMGTQEIQKLAPRSPKPAAGVMYDLAEPVFREGAVEAVMLELHLRIASYIVS